MPTIRCNAYNKKVAKNTNQARLSNWNVPFRINCVCKVNPKAPSAIQKLPYKIRSINFLRRFKPLIELRVKTKNYKPKTTSIPGNKQIHHPLAVVLTESCPVINWQPGIFSINETRLALGGFYFLPKMGFAVDGFFR